MSFYSENDPRRREYMKTLNLQAELNNRVLQAVKLNQATGQVMFPPTDNRTLDEKLADAERLKAKVRSDLLTITDGQNMTAIMSRLDMTTLRFVAQKFELLAREIRPKYALGITEGQFFNFLQAYMQTELVAPVAGREAGRNDLTQALRALPSREQMTRLNENLNPTPTVAMDLETQAEELGINPRHPNGRKKGKKTLQEEVTRRRQEAEEISGLSPVPVTPGAKPARKLFGTGLVSPLGKNTISTSKLHNDIVQIRTKRGSVIPKLPTEKVSRGVAAAVRRLVSGGSLTGDDIENLDENERRILHRIANRCELMERVPISEPKDAEAKMNDDFLLYKGQICAGNDNVELVKKFKLLILKMTQLDLLPKSQVREILVDLLSLGH